MCTACLDTECLTSESAWHAPSAHCDCRELGFIPVEVNASDTRNKADKSAKAGMGGKLSNAIKELANNTALNMAQDGQRKKARPRRPMRCGLPHVPVMHLSCTSLWRSITQGDKSCAVD